MTVSSTCLTLKNLADQLLPNGPIEFLYNSDWLIFEIIHNDKTNASSYELSSIPSFKIQGLGDTYFILESIDKAGVYMQSLGEMFSDARDSGLSLENTRILIKRIDENKSTLYEVKSAIIARESYSVFFEAGDEVE